MNANEKLNQLIVEYFKEEDKLSPSRATYMGIHDYDSELEDFSQEGLKRIKESAIRHLSQLENISFDELDRDGKIRYHLMNERIKSTLRSFDDFKTYEDDPSTYAGIAVHSIFMLLLREFAPLEVRLKSASDRMKKIPKLFEAAKQNLKNPPEIYITIFNNIVKGGVSIFSDLIPKMAAMVPEELANEVMKSQKIALEAFKDYEDFVMREVKPRATGDFAIGKELLDTLLTETEFLDYNSDDLWEIGNRELEKCEQELVEFVKREYKTDRPWREVFKEMKKNYPPKDKVLDIYREYLEKAKKFMIDRNIVTNPENQNVIAMETPEFSRSTTPLAAMMPPAAFDSNKTGYLFVTPVDPNQSHEDQEKQLMESSYGKVQYLTLHEAYPGHHLQLVYASNVPDHLYRRTHSGIFIEGWAFYCEQMMKELGYFNRDGELAQLEAAYWRALRILLDVGLHTRRFTYDEAMKFMLSKVDWAPFIAKGELNRYTQSPTQALSYYTGKLEIFRIKDAYMKKKGNSFSLKEFHEDLLNCSSLPPKLVEWKLGLREIEKPIPYRAVVKK
jgi:uncharacterized protein (DUF885 family)